MSNSTQQTLQTSNNLLYKIRKRECADWVPPKFNPKTGRLVQTITPEKAREQDPHSTWILPNKNAALCAGRIFTSSDGITYCKDRENPGLPTNERLPPPLQPGVPPDVYAGLPRISGVV